MDPISIEMQPLLKQAREEGKWLWCNYQDLWFSPDQLAREQANGRFRWGAVNWKLRDPRERLQEAQAIAERAKADRDRIAQCLAEHGIR